MSILDTERLILRRWQESDFEPFAAMNADPEVMRYFPAPLSREKTARFIKRAEEKFDQYGFGTWVAERKDTGAFIGFVSLDVPEFQAPFMPCVEVGWRLDRAHWGHGFATEGAHAALNHGFNVSGLDEIVSFTSRLNKPSLRVMERLGMARDPEGDFDHPDIEEEGHPLRPHVLYRLSKAAWSGDL